MAYVEISEDLRKMTIPATEKVLGCVGDHNVRHVYFRMPRYCDDIDLSTLRLQVHYVNALGQEDYYEVPTRTIDDTSIIFGWLVRYVACLAEGTVSANIKLRAYNDEGIVKEFNSGIGRFRVKPAFSSDPFGSQLIDDDGSLIVPIIADDIMVLATEDSE